MLNFTQTLGILLILIMNPAYGESTSRYLSFLPTQLEAGGIITLQGRQPLILSRVRDINLNGQSLRGNIITRSTNQLQIRVPVTAKTGLLRVIDLNGRIFSGKLTILPSVVNPKLASISPSKGMVGNSVSLVGENLSSDLRVVFETPNSGSGFIVCGLDLKEYGVEPCKINSAQSAEITKLPQPPVNFSLPGEFLVKVFDKKGNLVDSKLKFSLESAVPAPKLASISPSKGMVGSSVSLVGENLSSDLRVVFETPNSGSGFIVCGLDLKEYGVEPCKINSAQSAEITKLPQPPVNFSLPGEFLVKVFDKKGNLVDSKLRFSLEVEQRLGIKRTGIKGVQLSPRALNMDSQENIYVRGKSYLDMNKQSTFSIKLNRSGERVWPETLEAPGFNSSSIAWPGPSVIDRGDNLIVANYVYIPRRSRGVLNLTKSKSNDLSVLWSVPVEFGPYPVALTLDEKGNIFVLGRSYLSESSDAYLIKFNTNGEAQWQKTLQALTPKVTITDSKGNIYVGGQQANQTGAMMPALIRLNSDGVVDWNLPEESALVGGAITAMASDKMGNLFLAGNTENKYPEKGGNYFLTKLLPTGSRAWTMFGTSGAGQVYGTEVNALGINSSGNVYVVGSTRGPLDNQIIENLNTNSLFVAMYSLEGKRQWTKLLQAQEVDSWKSYGHTSGRDLVIDKAGNAVVLGGVSGPISLEGIPAVGEADTFIVKFNVAGEIQ